MADQQTAEPLTHDNFVATTLRAEWPLSVLMKGGLIGHAMHASTTKVCVRFVGNSTELWFDFDRFQIAGVLLVDVGP